MNSSDSMRIPVVIFIIGLTIIVAGIVLAIATPSILMWQPKSLVITDEERLVASARWNSKSILVDEIVAVALHKTEEHFLVRTLIEEAKDFVMNGSAIEQSSPQHLFNFYIVDGENFNKWKSDLPYTAYYEAQEKTSTTFGFSIVPEEGVPEVFFLIIEESVVGEKPSVHVSATANWVEKASRRDCSEFFSSGNPSFIDKEVKDIVLEGSATEVDNNEFSFYILDLHNYEKWRAGRSYTSFYEVKNVTTTSFSIPLTKIQWVKTIRYVAENPLFDTKETVNVSLTARWNEKAPIVTAINGIILGGIVALMGLIVVIIAAMRMCAWVRIGP